MSALFHLTPEQDSIRQLAEDFARSAVLPVSKSLEAGNLETLKSLWSQLAEAGLTGLPFPEAYGGADVDSLSYILTLEALGKASASLATALSVHTSVGGLPILYYGTEAQKAEYLPDVVSAKKIAAFGLTEPNAGSDAANGLNRAELNGTGFMMNGTKIFITNALLAQVFIVTARTDKTKPGAAGISAFIVDRNLPGFTITKGDEKMGLCGSDWGELYFENVPVAADKMLGPEGEGFKVFMRTLDVGRISIGAISLGIAQACLDASVQYVKEREQFGKPLSAFQAIQFKLADMATRIEASRQLVYHAARLKDAEQPFRQQASFAKLYASETCNFCAKEAIQIFGGYGYTKDFPVERYFRDAKVMELVEGTSQVQRVVISRQLLA